MMPKVMLVDDERALRDVVSAVLSAQGIGVITASGAGECLNHLRGGFRGVILMDVMMPDKSGWETIREIERENLLEGNIVVMLTGSEAPTDEMNGLQEIVLDYITKPFRQADFIASVKKYLEFL